MANSLSIVVKVNRQTDRWRVPDVNLVDGFGSGLVNVVVIPTMCALVVSRNAQ